MDEDKGNQAPFVPVANTFNKPNKTTKLNKLLIIIGVVLILFLVSIVLYIIKFKNTQLILPNAKITTSPTIFQSMKPINMDNVNPPSTQPRPSIVFPYMSSVNIATAEGNVYFASGNQRQLLIDKRDYYKQYGESFYITKASLSPDNSKLLLSAEGIVSIPILFYSKTDNFKNLIEIAPSEEAVWSPNSRYIAFTGSAGDGGFQNVQLEVYDTHLNIRAFLASIYNLPKIQNLNFNTIIYDQLRWLADNSGFQVHYKAFLDRRMEEKVGEGIERVGEGSLTFPLSMIQKWISNNTKF